MQDTCKSEGCVIYKKLKLKSPEQCPNYILSTWTNDKNEIKLTKDCTPIKTSLMQAEFHNRLIAIQRAIEQLRNETTWVQVVAEVLGKNSGVDLEAFVKERQRIMNVKQLETYEVKTETRQVIE